MLNIDLFVLFENVFFNLRICVEKLLLCLCHCLFTHYTQYACNMPCRMPISLILLLLGVIDGFNTTKSRIPLIYFMLKVCNIETQRHLIHLRVCRNDRE